MNIGTAANAVFHMRQVEEKELKREKIASWYITVPGIPAQEKEKLEAALQQRRQAWKEKNQQLSDVKAICELEARIAGLEAERARLQPGAPCPLCGSEHHPAVA